MGQAADAQLVLGQSQFITAPTLAKSLQFDLSIGHEGALGHGVASSDSESRLMEMLAAQAAHRDGGSRDEDDIANDTTLVAAEKAGLLQRALNMAASNGDMDRIQRILNGKGRDIVDLDAPDEEGTSPLIYASCFVSESTCIYRRILTMQGHEAVVIALLDAGADVDKRDRNQWTALMWAMTNKHKSIARALLDHGASPDARSSTGRTAFDFAAPDNEMSDYLHDSGYLIGSAGVTDDFYNAGFSQDRFEEEMAENEQRRRMMMESARDLEVDLGNLGIDDKPEVCVTDFSRSQTLTDAGRLLKNWKKMLKILIGHDAFTTKCSSFKKVNWNAYWISLLQT